jgi:TonB-dependent SusC/RagA subfamily outer membrane receptor
MSKYTKMRTRLLFMMVLLSVICLDGIAGKGGKIRIKGTVKDASDNPVENAVILADGATTGAQTNVRGQYVVKVSRDAQSIGVIAPGNIVTADLIDGRTRIDFKLDVPVTEKESFMITPEIVSPDELANTGYGSIQKKYLTTEVRTINGYNRKYASYNSVDDIITRECSGVKASNGTYVIQNSANLSGPVPALLIVDGTYVKSFDGITPASVESINVLKGTSATIYGSRGYGGAIVITTKK